MSNAGTPGPVGTTPAGASTTETPDFFAVPLSPQTAPYEETDYPATSFSAPLPIVDASAPQKPKRPRRRRGLFWVLVLMAIVVILAGSIAAVVTYVDQGKPSGVVKSYFAALSRGDASAALGFGTIHPGARTLLTDAVLHAQNEIGRIENVAVLAETGGGDSVTVTVQYSLAMAAGSTSVTDTVPMTRSKGSWRLVSAVVPVQIAFSGAANRISVAGAVVPDGQQQLFPGAAPFRFDTPNLQLAEHSAVIRFAGTTSPLQVELSKAGVAKANAAIAQAVATCLAGTAPVQANCPMPVNGRSVPGTLRGKTSKPTAQTVSVSLEASADGYIDGAGNIDVVGNYQGLNFDNLASPTDFSGSVPVSLKLLATAPDTVTWASS